MNVMCKRAFDLAVSVPLALLSVPIIAPLAVVMAFNTKSNPFFLQVRLGKDLKPFVIYKIKTMSDKRDDAGVLLPDSERTSKLGEWVRKSRLDEVPQFFNVVKGDMSVVGPRPHMIRDHIWWDKKRGEVRPGITGMGKIFGFKNLTPKNELFNDHIYIDAMKGLNPLERVVFDVLILAQTPTKIIQHWSSPHSRDLQKIKIN